MTAAAPTVGPPASARRPRVGVVTIVAGRHRHLTAHLRALSRSEPRADVHVVVAMGDREVADLVDGGGSARSVVSTLVHVPDDGELPLAEARNVGAAATVDAGCDLVVMLDVDCLVTRSTLAAYVDAHLRAPAMAGPGAGPVVLSGPVAYLPPPRSRSGYPLEGLHLLADPHPARPAPPPGELVLADDLRLFWSLSFALSARDWQRVGGFATTYRGYGGEDTDFGMRLAAAGGRLYWVGGAEAYHQHHPVESPPVRHLESVVRNANHFREQWGWFPMEGWLEGFERLGLARHDAARDLWVVTGADGDAVEVDVALDHASQ
ncbi:GT2 family glycosyltransferase [Terracoccus luteus]|uniref:GT2 family glycosyltransferase n=1 Tax=Terracoccus luteus TaxID=53356 RepID=A0A839PZ24_9MICO|nr:galactosyltransferase-related protein [Terracoccus luteus]MBB2986042.1 GT2 family glycosyltransferase [Terracoccus luteus]MCP2171694.1 GT2 family glycosyltransferase [Terracoccus luteus]